MEIYITIGIGIALMSIIKYFEDSFCLACRTNGRKIVSILIGAISVSIFVELLDDIYTGIHATQNLLVLFLPVGFIISLLIEKHINNHAKNRKLKELGIFAKMISFFSGLIIGILAFQIIQGTLVKEIFFLLMLVSYDMIRDLSMHVIHEEKQKATTTQKISRVFLSLSPVYGLLIAWSLPITPFYNVSLLALFGGAMIYIVAKEVLPKEKYIDSNGLLLGSSLTVLIYLFSLSI